MPKKIITLEEIRTLSHKTLSGMLYTMSQKDQEIHAKLEKLLLSANPKELVKAIKKDIVSIKRGRKFIEYHMSFEFSQKIQSIIDDISSMVEDKKIASKLYKELILTDSKVYLRTDDSSGVIQGSYATAMDGWLNCIAFLNDDELYTDIKEMLFCEGFGLRNILNETIPKGVLIRLYDEFFPIPVDTNMDAFDKLSLLRETAHYLKDVERYIEAKKLQKESLSQIDFLDIAKEYQYANSPKKVLSTLDSVQEVDSYSADEFYGLKVWAYEALQQPFDVTLMYKYWYEKTQSVHILKKYLSRLDGTMQEKVKKEALKSVEDFPVSVALDFFYNLDEKSLVAKSILEHQDREIKIMYGEPLKKITQWLEDEYPQETILLHRDNCENSLERAISKYYPYAIKALKECLRIEEEKNISLWHIESNDDYMAQLLEKHKKKSKFIQLFNAI
ncbi:MAG: Unknown protein [uncultured Sulfurovum sp.]|uniref:Uncharacterized protein n=1 Tax=uncultured Sulfurovum sp. TaxID=269237 RepID=A0A6S6T6C7_9BACT|nr:MAG: Unknown protein [uncultured Sulfurovum sp.]